MKELLKGNESLVTAFWFLGFGYVLFSIGLGALMSLAQNIIVNLFSIIAVVIFFIIYEISVWRCAHNCSWIGWATLARIIVVSRALVFPVTFTLNMFGSSEVGGTINVYAIIFEIIVSLIALSLFSIMKVSGGDLSKPDQLKPKNISTNANYLKDAKTKFLAGDYEGALVLFNTADSIEALDDNSKSFQTMCLRRLNKHKNAPKQRRK
jgi:hypothetical protein